MGIFGPVLGPDLSTSILIVQRLMDGAMPGCPRLSFGLVDVRDVADLHLRAMTHPAAKGERFLAVAGDVREHSGDRAGAEGAPGRRRATGSDADAARTGWCASSGSSTRRWPRSSPELGKLKNATSEKARRVLGWQPRSSEDAIVATAESLMRLGLLRASKVAG